MKYLRKFNEELKPGTYMSASRKLAKMGHTGRAEVLKSWASEMEKKEEIIKWRDHLQDFAPFGIFKMNIVNTDNGRKMTADFALDINFDELAFEDNFEWEKEKDPNNIKSVGFSFFIGLIPTSEEILEKCNEIMPEPEFGNGMFWGMCCMLDFEVVNGQVKFTEFSLDNYDEGLSGDVSFADRASANKFKTLLKNIFSNPDLNYPSGYTDIEYAYQKLEQVICIQNSFSSEYGFELKHAADFVNLQSPNTMYETI